MMATKRSASELAGIFTTLTEEHRQVSALLERARKNPEERGQLWPTIRAQLLSHERGEIRELYPVLRSKPATAQLADHHDAEAKDMEDTILDLDLIPPASEAWGARFDELVESVLHHVKEEEQEMFPQAQAALGEAMALELDAKYLDAKQKLVVAV